MNQSLQLKLRAALVQFITIVVGVLAALAADDWAVARQERSLESAYLQRLVSDLRADTTELSRVVRMWQAYESGGYAALGFLREISTNVEDPNQLVAQFALASFTSLPNIETATYDELKSSGLLRVFRDPEVRRALAAYQARLAYGDPFIDRQTQEFRLFVQGHVPPEFYVSVRPECLVDGVPHPCSPRHEQLDPAVFLAEARRDPGVLLSLNIRMADVIRTREIMEERYAVAVETLARLEGALEDG